MRNNVHHNRLKYLISVVVFSLLTSVTVFTGASVAGQTTAGKGSIENRVERLERLMGSEKQLELLYHVNQLKKENQQLRSLIEEQNHQLRAVKNQQRELYRDLNQRLNQVEKGRTPRAHPSTNKLKTSSVTPASTSAAASSAAASSVATKSSATEMHTEVEIVDKSIQVQRGRPEMQTRIQRESIIVEPAVNEVQEKNQVYVSKPMSAKERRAEQKVYQKAYDELRAKHYARARESFADVIDQYPHGRYAHIAQYWMGESSYAQKNYRQAIEDYQLLIDFYPNSPKRAESQLKKAYSLYEMNDRENARITLEQLLAQYPGTTEASQAKRLLKNL